MGIPISVLIVENNSEEVFRVIREIKAHGLSPLYRVIESPKDWEEAVYAEDWDLVLCTFEEPHRSNIQSYLKFLADKSLDIPFLLITNQEDYKSSLSLMKEGVLDVIDRESLSRLTEVMERERRSLVYRREKDTTTSFLFESLKEIQLQKFALDKANIVSTTDANGIITYVNDAFLKISGYERSELIGSSHRILKSQDKTPEDWKKIWESIQSGQVWKGEIKNTTKSGDTYYVDTTIVPFTRDDGSIFQYIAIHHDITDRKVAEKQLTQDAFFDNLTGLPNRSLFLVKIELKISEYNTHNYGFPIVFSINIDNFKRINHSLGNDAGDEILMIFAKRLLEISGDDAIVSRLSADNFAILKMDLLVIEEAVEFSERILEFLGNLIDYRGYQIYLTASTGIASFGTAGREADVLLRNSEIAMFEAKSLKVGTTCVFNMAMQERIHYQLDIQNDLKKAFALNEFFVCYQPIVNLHTKTIDHWEALIRWKHPIKGMVSPVDFIPMAESSGLIVPLTKFVLSETVKLIDWIEKTNHIPISIAVNLSPHVFYDQNIFHWIVDLHKNNGIRYNSIQVEITESLAMNNLTETIPILSNLIDIGIKVALDDFGTGFSSLSYLEKLPLSTLKIDKSFLHNVSKESKEGNLFESIIQMAHVLGYEVVAEGVEEEEQLNLLNDFGCDQIQGYLISKPIPHGKVLPFLNHFKYKFRNKK